MTFSIDGSGRSRSSADARNQPSFGLVLDGVTVLLNGNADRGKDWLSMTTGWLSFARDYLAKLR